MLMLLALANKFTQEGGSMSEKVIIFGKNT